ncbi:MAG TPA: hypothetical protein VNF24_01460 [Candidatus Acidoferrales bacterium]|nr:hypothetical protein [Candidatus Acidoferrales bacterium]
MTSTTSYPQELRKRAERLVLEHSGEYPSEWATIVSDLGQAGDDPSDAAEMGTAGAGGLGDAIWGDRLGAGTNPGAGASEH